MRRGKRPRVTRSDAYACETLALPNRLPLSLGFLDLAPLSTSMSKTCIPTPVLRSIQLSLWIEGRIGRRLHNSSCLNPALRRQIPIGLPRTADRDDSRPSNRRKGRIRSSYLNLSDGSGDKQAKFAPMEEFVEIRSGDGEAENIVTESTREGEGDGFEGSFPSTFDFLELKREFEKEEAASRLIGPEENDFIPPGGDGSVALESDESGELIQQVDAKGRRQMLKRSNLLAKQVISMRSARSLGFVSQLWVDTRSVSVSSRNINVPSLSIILSIVGFVVFSIHGYWLTFFYHNNSFFSLEIF